MPSNFSPPSTRDEFDVAILCAKQLESDAVVAMFDNLWHSSAYGKMPGDQNEYELGRIRNHNVALGYLPGMGIANSASAASSFLSSFPKIRLGLVVGICGGVPTINGRNDTITEVLLGDVIISTQVMEYRYGTQRPDSFIEKDTLREAPREIQSFLHRMNSIVNHENLEEVTSLHLAELQSDQRYKSWKYLGADRDRLHTPLHRHKHHRNEDRCETCNNCNNHEDRVCEAARTMSCETLGCSEVVNRARLAEARESAQTRDPDLRIHFGAVASGDVVMKSGHHRDKIVTRDRPDGQRIIAFEMEGAGVWDTLPTLVIKGVSDYSDSHKRDEWQQFAAARAAACTKGIVEEWSQLDTHRSIVILSARNHVQQAGTLGVQQVRRLADEKIDRAELLIEKRAKESMKRDLEEAHELLMQVMPENLSFDSHRRVYWGLMIAEKELSCHGSFVDEEKISHITKAEKWNSELLSQNLSTHLQIHANLEKYIIQGRKASLGLKREPESLEASRSKDEAIKGIDRTLEELKEKDLNKYKEVEKHARQWRVSIRRPRL